MSKRKNSDSSTPPPPGPVERHWSRSTDQEYFLPECEPSSGHPMNQPTDEDFKQVLNLLQQPETPERSLNMACAMTGPGRELLSFSPILPVSAATAAPLEAVAADTPAYGGGKNHGKSIIETYQTHHSTITLVSHSTSCLTHHASSDLEMEASYSASIPDRAASEYGSSILQGNSNNFQDIYYKERLSQPFSTPTRQTSYEETSQDTWIERERLFQRCDREIEMLGQSLIHEGRERIDQTIREVSDVLSTSETIQSIHEGRERVNHISDECNKILSTFSSSVECPRRKSYENYEEHINALAVTSVLLEALPLGAPGGRKRNHGKSMIAAFSLSRLNHISIPQHG